MKTFNSEKFCTNLVSLRKDSTQMKVSELLGVNRSTLSLLEGGKQIPSLEILNKVCELSKTSPNEYFIEEESDGLVYLMGTLEESDKEKLLIMMEQINIREKYAILNRRSL